MILSTTTFACDRKGADRERAATTKAAHAVDDQATEDLQAKTAAEAKVIEAKATADLETAKAHEVTEAQLQENFDAADRRLNMLQAKVAKLTGAKKQQAAAPVAAAEAQGAKVMASVAKLREARGAQWEPARAQVDVDSAALTSAIDALEASLQ